MEKVEGWRNFVAFMEEGGKSRNGGRMVKKMKMELRENGEEREK